MVRKIKVVDVYSQEVDESNIETYDDDDDDYDEITEELLRQVAEAPRSLEVEPRQLEEEARQEQPEQSDDDEPPEITKTKSRTKKQVLDMPITNKIIEQVQCLSCVKSVSATTLKYSHAKYCTERNQEPQPEEIPVPQIEIKNAQTLKGRKSLPVKRTKTTPQPNMEEAYEPPPPPSR
jgi:hypothetical protein